MKKTKYFSYKINSLAKGCQYCVKGSKLVMFVTGLCPRRCFYCPISDKKYQKDVIYADEWPVKNIRDIIQEAKLINAQGAGFTGGDPLKKIQRTTFIIRKLKKHFGQKFHTHLYTSFDLVNQSSLKKLHQAGLDEIRFHPDIFNQKLWPKIKLAQKFSWDIGIEIPAIPKKFKQTQQLVDYFHDKIRFLNLNELEIADNKTSQLSKLGFITKDAFSYAVKGSEETALQLLKYIEKKKYRLNVHYCTAKLKDAVQLANRIKRRAKNIKQPFDQVKADGTLIRGAIYLPELKPGFNYRRQLEKIKNKNPYLKKLKNFQKKIKTPSQIDPVKLRLITSKKYVTQNKNLIKKLDLIPAVVHEYPTWDSFEIEISFL